MTDDEKELAQMFYTGLMFEMLVNIKAVNSGVFNKYIADMDESDWNRWNDFFEILKETGWIPK